MIVTLAAAAIAAHLGSASPSQSDLLSPVQYCSHGYDIDIYGRCYPNGVLLGKAGRMGVADIIGVAAIAITTVDAAIIERAHSALACGFAFGCLGTTALPLAGCPVGDSARVSGCPRRSRTCCFTTSPFRFRICEATGVPTCSSTAAIRTVTTTLRSTLAAFPIR